MQMTESSHSLKQNITVYDMKKNPSCNLLDYMFCFELASLLWINWYTNHAVILTSGGVIFNPSPQEREHMSLSAELNSVQETQHM